MPFAASSNSDREFLSGGLRRTLNLFSVALSHSSSAGPDEGNLLPIALVDATEYTFADKIRSNPGRCGPRRQFYISVYLSYFT